MVYYVSPPQQSKAEQVEQFFYISFVKSSKRTL